VIVLQALQRARAGNHEPIAWLPLDLIDESIARMMCKRVTLPNGASRECDRGGRRHEHSGRVS
jgi:hypothetical protein